MLNFISKFTKKIIVPVIAGLTLANIAVAQQPQSSTAPISSINAKYVDGAAMGGFRPTISSGLILSIGSGTSFCGTAVQNYAGNTVTLTDNTTNYVYLDTTSSCIPAFNTSGFTSTGIPIAVVITSGGVITNIADIRTMFFTVSGGGGGSCGPVSGDSSSTDCGSGNNIGASYNGPPNDIQTYGFTLNVGASGDNGVTIGHDAGTNSTFRSTVAIGDFDYSTNDPTTGLSGRNSVFIGTTNAAYFGGSGSGVGASFTDAIGIGDSNFITSSSSSNPNFTDIYAFGDHNMQTRNVSIVPGTFRDIVAIGDIVGNDMGSGTDLVAIGDGSLSGANTPPGPSYSDIVAIGDTAASTPPNGSSTLVAIGFCPMCIGDNPSVSGALSESIALGDEALNSGANTHDLIAIGNEAMFGPETGPCLSAVPHSGSAGTGYLSGDTITVVSGTASGCTFTVTASGGTVTSLAFLTGGDGYRNFNNLSTTGGTGTGLLVDLKANTYTTGNDNIAIGAFAGSAFRLGSENIAIGTNACSVGYGSGPTLNGNSTTDGSENICIGDTAGQSVSTPLDDIIVIGNHAEASVSHQTVIGSPTTTSLLLFGCTSGEAVLSDGSGTCFTPSGSSQTALSSTSITPTSINLSFVTAYYHFQIPYTLVKCASTTCDVPIATVPQGFTVTKLTVVETTSFAGPTGLTAGTVSFGQGVSAPSGYMSPRLIYQTANTTNQNGGNISMSFTTSGTALSAEFLNTTPSTPGNFGNGTTTSLTAGLLDVYLEYTVEQ